MRGRAVLFGCVVAVAGCGGGGDASPTNEAVGDRSTTSVTVRPTTTSTSLSTASTTPAPPATTVAPAATVATVAPATTVVARPTATAPPRAPVTTTPAEPPPAAGPASVAITDYVYAPDPVRVRAGASITWTNNDGAPHTATAQDGGWDTGSLSKGQAGTVRFDTPGTYPYTCTLHPTMKGRVIVV